MRARSSSLAPTDTQSQPGKARRKMESRKGKEMVTEEETEPIKPKKKVKLSPPLLDDKMINMLSDTAARSSGLTEGKSSQQVEMVVIEEEEEEEREEEEKTDNTEKTDETEKKEDRDVEEQDKDDEGQGGPILVDYGDSSDDSDGEDDN
ncbi:hypothetical protein L1987_02052 [Smallanthus sonchifolius]|uniref:Uncharacterized protein n=1 Tax=Smallanthus sonchifolius TaxID=185202 RepID=A0ACB9K6W6_9ASTR|nr:hypothetical protein L1987_02052 [Smallanthus sonchifolius]